MLYYFRLVGKPIPEFSLHMHNRIPLTGGLGSSSAALVAGLFAANEICGRALTRQELLVEACKLEGHPDNVAPCILGGLVVSVIEDNQVISIPAPLPRVLRAVIFAPDFYMSTVKARAILPKRVPYQDATHNVSRVALLVAALYNERLDLLRTATQDRLHQEYRTKMFPDMYQYFESATNAGALCAYLSGAGSAILALAEAEKDREPIAQAFLTTARGLGMGGRVFTVGICEDGAERVELFETTSVAGAHPHPHSPRMPAKPAPGHRSPGQ
jgi:homoserine kinase